MTRILFLKASPTPAQAEAGNYKKRKLQWHGLTISIENEAGSIRRGKGWQTKMVNAYGYFNETTGVDKDQLDVYIGPDDSADTVYVVHQRKFGDWSKFDEDKIMICFESEAAARAAYLKHYDDPRFLGPITAMPVDEFVDKARATKDAPKMIKALFLKGGEKSGWFSPKHGGTHADIGERIERVIVAVGLHALVVEKISGVTDEESKELGVEIGIDGTGYVHTVDNYAVSHSLKRHGSPAEYSHGQIPIGLTDIREIPGAILHPDAVIYGAKNARNQDLIGRVKILQDGSILLVEEVRVGNKQLAMASIRKYPATKDASAIARSLLHNVRNGSGDAVNIVEHTSPGQGHQVFHIEASFTKSITLIFPNGNEYALGADQYSFEADDSLLKALEAGQRWISVHPNGPGTKGVPVMIQESQHGSGVYHVIGGAGGKLNYLKLRGIKPESSYKEHAAEKKKAKTAEKKVLKARDKELGLDKGKEEARGSVKAQRHEADKAFVKKVADKMGWKEEDLAPKIPENVSDATRNKLEQRHHSELLTKAHAAVELQHQNLLTDAMAREEAGGAVAVPDEHTPPEQLTVADLDDARPQAKAGLGFAAHYAERAAEQGASAEAIAQEAGEKKTARQADLSDNQRAAIKTRGDKAQQIKAEIEAIREPVTASVKAVLASAVDAVELIKAQKEWKAVQKAAQAANKDIDEATEVKAYNLEVSAPEEGDIADDLEADLRTIRTKAFLSTIDKESSAPEKELRQHVSAGAFNSINALALTAGGNALVDRSVIDVLGMEGAARVLARRLHADLPADEMEKLTAGMEDWHVHHYMESSKAAMQEAQELHDAAKEIQLGEASHGADFEAARELNHRRKAAIEQSHKILGTALGEMEANAAIVTALKAGRSDKPLEVPLGKIADEDAIRQARAIGLQRGDYSIDKVAGNQVLTVTPEGLDRLSKPVDREELARTKNTLDILNGGQDEDDWLPQGFAKRPDLAMDLKPGVAATLAKPFAPEAGNLQQSLKDYIGGRAADGDSPADIVADIQSSDFFQKAGDADAYREALDAVAPLKGKDGKMARAESLTDSFNEMADSFVAREYGGKISTLQRQQFEPDHVAQDALHRALADEPAGVVAYKPIGELTNDDQRALREHFYAHVAHESPEAAGLRERLEKMGATEPEKETEDMFGETSINPDWHAWKAQRDTLAEEVGSASLDWQKYASAMNGHVNAYGAIQDLIRSKVGKSFNEHYNKLNPAAPLKLGRQVIRGNLNHLDAVDPEARKAREAKERELTDSLRERNAGQYASGSVSDKLDAERERREAFQQSQMGFFSTEEDHSAGNLEKVDKPLGADERYTLGHAAERTIAGMMPLVGHNFKPGQPVRLFNPTMSGPDGVMRQRAIKIIEANKRVILAAGAGCVRGDTILDDAEGRGWTFADWWLSGESPTVYALDKAGAVVEAKSSPVFAKKSMPMKRVSWIGGSITVSENHLFLTGRGWVFSRDLVAGDSLVSLSSKLKSSGDVLPIGELQSSQQIDSCAPPLMSCEKSLLTSEHRFLLPIATSQALINGASCQQMGEEFHLLDDEDEGGRSVIELALNSVGRYSHGPCLCDGQPRQEEGICQEPLPLQGDALQHIPASRQQDDPALKPSNSLCLSNFDLLSKHGYESLSALRFSREALGQCSLSASELLARQHQSGPQFARRSSVDLKTESELANRHLVCDLVSTPAIPVSPVLRHICESPAERSFEKCQALARKAERFSSCSIRQKQQGNQFSDAQTFSFPEVVTVVDDGNDTVFDLNVPEYSNYMANGVFHHNSGKTAMFLGAFSDLQSKGKIRKGVVVCPSIVQGQVGAEALRFMEPGKYNWHCDPGGSFEDRLAAYKDPDTHFSVVTHQSFRDDVLKMAAMKTGEEGGAIAERMEGMTRKERSAFVKSVLDHHGINFDFSAIDEGHGLLDRSGKENSRMSNVIGGVTDNTGYTVSATADPIKNDISEAFSHLEKMDSERYNDRDAFMRRYGVDTSGAKDALKRELIRHVLPFQISPNVRSDKKEIKVKPSEAQNKALAELDKNLGKVRMARMEGRVDVEAMKAISPGQFKDAPEDQHEAITKELSASLGIIKGSAVRSILDSSPDSAKIDALSKLAGERKGKAGVVFAHSLEAVNNIKARLEKEGHRVMTLTGADSSADKAAKIRGFNPDKGERSHDILVASDAGSTGANLQSGSWLAQYETPLTAMCHAQRRARIDRIGQKQDIELIDLVSDHASDTKARERLKNKYELRELMSSPMGNLDDTGLAAFLKQRQVQQQSAALF